MKLIIEITESAEIVEVHCYAEEEHTLTPKGDAMRVACALQRQTRRNIDQILEIFGRPIVSRSEGDVARQQHIDFLANKVKQQKDQQ